MAKTKEEEILQSLKSSNKNSEDILERIGAQFKGVVIFLFKLTRILIVLIMGAAIYAQFAAPYAEPNLFIILGICLAGVVFWLLNIVSTGTITTLIGIREDVASLVKKNKK